MDKVNNLKGKTVLVTGSTGFKGSWLCVWLNRIGAKVIGYALHPESKSDNFNICQLESKIRQVYGDILSHDTLSKCVNYFQPDVVFHLAAQSIVLKSFVSPATTIATNVMGTVNVLDVLRSCPKTKSIVVVTSDKCYKNDGGAPEAFTEDCKLGGDDPYSASKACAEIVARSYYASFFKKNNVGLSTVRAGNVVGGGDRGKSRIVPDCIRSIELKKDVQIRNPTHIRPWQYVLEPLYGYLRIAALMLDNADEYSSAWNFGPSRESFVTVADFVTMLLANIPGKTGVLLGDGDGEREKKLLTIDSGRAERLLGVRNKLSIADVTRMVAEDYFTKEDPFEHCLNRIVQYESLIGGLR